MFIWNRLLIAALTLSVNFTYQATAMNKTGTKGRFKVCVKRINPLKKKLFNNDMSNEMNKKFLWAVYAQNDFGVQDYISAPALEYLEKYFFSNKKISNKKLNAIVNWTIVKGYRAITDRIVAASKACSNNIKI